MGPEEQKAARRIRPDLPPSEDMRAASDAGFTAAADHNLPPSANPYNHVGEFRETCLWRAWSMGHSAGTQARLQELYGDPPETKRW